MVESGHETWLRRFLNLEQQQKYRVADKIMMEAFWERVTSTMEDNLPDGGCLNVTLFMRTDEQEKKLRGLGIQSIDKPG